MISKLLAIPLVLYTQMSWSLQVVNISSRTCLSDLYLPGAPLELDSFLESGITLYRDPKDTSSTYLWIAAMGHEYGGNASYNYVKSDVFTTTLEQYKGIPSDKLPITIEYDQKGEIEGNAQCNSPITGDILTCVQMNGGIQCRLWFVNTNTLSDNISIIQDTGAGLGGLLCFNDSYLIIWSSLNKYVSVMDLNGKVLYNEIKLPQPQNAPKELQLEFVTMAQNKAKINVKNGGLFNVKMYYGQYGVFENVYNYYYYYTNINETQENLIKLYNSTSFYSILLTNSMDDTSLNLNDNCCFVSLFDQYLGPQNYNLYLVLTDIYGNNITINGKDYVEVVQGLGWGDFESLVDLSSISQSDDEVYFAISYLENSESNHHTFTLDIYSLKYDGKEYSLTNVGKFDTIQVDQTYDINTASAAHHLLGTNYVYFAWEQSVRSGNDFTDINFYAQGFEIKQD